MTPTTPGWYWYKEAGTNADEPMPVWVFAIGKIFYAARMAPHEQLDFGMVHRLSELPGEWLGKVEGPK